MEPIAGASSIVAFRIITASFVFMPSRPPRTGCQAFFQLCMQPASAGFPLHFINLQTTFHERFVLRLSPANFTKTQGPDHGDSGTSQSIGYALQTHKTAENTFRTD